MSSVKRNFGWNMLLTVSSYIFPLITFPYVTRVLGAANLGLANFAMSFVDYAVLLSTLGLGYIGCREISQNSGNKEVVQTIFSRLISLHIIMTTVILLIYVSCIFFIPEFSSHKQLYFVGIIKILTNILLIEWLFQSFQDFRYITICSLVLKALYVVGVFVFVQSEEDYDAYFYISIAQISLNGLINWRYSRKYVSFRLQFRGCLRYFFPVLSMGLNLILFSFYSSFNVLYLGMKSSTEAVGYFTTATKLYGVLLAVISAYNGVFVPYLNQLYGQGEMCKFKDTVEKSIPLVCMVSLPIITIGILYAQEIILLIAGKGYERAVLPFQIVMIQILLVGLAQIFENQILLSFKQYKEILICTVSSVLLAILIIVAFVPQYAEVASAYAVAIPHIVEAALLYYFVKKVIDISFPMIDFLKNLIACVPIAIVCFSARALFDNYIMALLVTGIISVIYYFAVQYYVLRNELLINQTKRVTMAFCNMFNR